MIPKRSIFTALIVIGTACVTLETTQARAQTPAQTGPLDESPPIQTATASQQAPSLSAPEDLGDVESSTETALPPLSQPARFKLEAQGEQDDDPAERTAQAERAFLRGLDEGSFNHPIDLNSVDKTSKICAALKDESKLSEASHRVYRVLIPPGRFDAHTHKGSIALRIDKSMATLEGAVVVSAIPKAGAAFSLPADQAADNWQKIVRRQVALEIIFRMDNAQGMSACFSYPRSGAYSLRIAPLSYALVDSTSEQRLAAVTTPLGHALKRIIDPGPATLHIDSEILEGGLDMPRFESALMAQKENIQKCLSRQIASRDATVVLVFSAELSSAGGVRDVHLDLGTMPDGPVSACVARAISSVALTHASKDARVSVEIQLARGEELALSQNQ